MQRFLELDLICICRPSIHLFKFKIDRHLRIQQNIASDNGAWAFVSERYIFSSHI